MTKYGFIKPQITNDNYILGSSILPKEEIRFDGQWDRYLPDEEFQRHENYDTFNCTGFGTQNCIETLIKAKYAEIHDFCERDLGIRAGTYPPGNDPHVVAEAMRKNGLIPDSMLPIEDAKTVDEYYSYPTDKKRRECDGACIVNRRNFRIGHEWVFKGDVSIADQTKFMKEALKYSPLGVAVYAWYEENGVYIRKGDDVHWCMIYGYYENGDWKCFDSYDYSTKRLSKDFGFSYVKRYHVERVLGKVEESVWKKLVKLLKDLGILSNV